MACGKFEDVIQKGKLVDVDENHNKKRFPTISLAATIEIDNKPYFMGVSIRQIQAGDNRYYMHNVVAEDIESLKKMGGNSAQQFRAAQSGVDRTTENLHRIYSILKEIAKRKQNQRNNMEIKEAGLPNTLKGAHPQNANVGLTASNNSISNSAENVKQKYSMKADTEQMEMEEVKALEDMRADAELYSQMQMDEDARAALLMLRQLHRLTKQGRAYALLSAQNNGVNCGNCAARRGCCNRCGS